jgi:threonine synthase
MHAERADGAGRLRHECVRCGRRFPHGYTPRCPSCGGLVEIVYDVTRARCREATTALERYVDFLPILDPRHLLSLGEGGTPCLHARRLGEILGLERVYLKVEAHNPTGTTKDRMAAVVLSLFNELGIREFVSCSTGNSSSALGYGIARHPGPGFLMHLFVGSEFMPAVRFADGNPGVRLHALEGASFNEAFRHAQTEARRLGLPFEAGFFNPARREGLKLAYFEAVEQVPTEIDWYVQGVSSAMGAYGTWKGAGELQAFGRIRTRPRIVAVQQESCSPMVKAYEDGSPVIRAEHVFSQPTGIATALLRGDPSECYPYVYEIVRASRGAMLSVSEGEIRAGRDRLREIEGVDCAYAAATTVAALAKLVQRGAVGPRDTVLLNLTG